MREGNTIQYVGKAECEIVGTTITTTLIKGGEWLSAEKIIIRWKKKNKSNVCGLVNRSTWAVIFLVYFPMVSSFISSACITLEKEGMFYSQSCASHSFQKALAPISPGSPHTNQSVCRCLMSPSWVQWDQHWKLAPRGEQEPTIVSMLNDVGLALMTQGIL